MEQMQNSETIAGKLKQYRLKHDMTFEALASLVDVEPSTIYRIENGLVDPNERTLYKIRKALPELFESAA